jgi:hypothetical protein
MYVCMYSSRTDIVRSHNAMQCRHRIRWMTIINWPRVHNAHTRTQKTPSRRRTGPTHSLTHSLTPNEQCFVCVCMWAGVCVWCMVVQPSECMYVNVIAVPSALYSIMATVNSWFAIYVYGRWLHVRHAYCTVQNESLWSFENTLIAGATTTMTTMMHHQKLPKRRTIMPTCINQSWISISLAISISITINPLGFMLWSTERHASCIVHVVPWCRQAGRRADALEGSLLLLFSIEYCIVPRRFQNFASRVSRLKCQSPLHWWMPMPLQVPHYLLDITHSITRRGEALLVNPQQQQQQQQQSVSSPSIIH